MHTGTSSKPFLEASKASLWSIAACHSGQVLKDKSKIIQCQKILFIKIRNLYFNLIITSKGEFVYKHKDEDKEEEVNSILAIFFLTCLPSTSMSAT